MIYTAPAKFRDLKLLHRKTEAHTQSQVAVIGTSVQNRCLLRVLLIKRSYCFVFEGKL